MPNEEINTSNIIIQRHPAFEGEGRSVKDMLLRYLHLYRDKKFNLTDMEWLEKLFLMELADKPAEPLKQVADRLTHRERPGEQFPRDAQDVQLEQAAQMAEAIVEAVRSFDSNLASVYEACQRGVDREKWLADKLQEGAIGMSVQEYGQRLQVLHDALHAQNAKLAEALASVEDGNIPLMDVCRSRDNSAAALGETSAVGGRRTGVDGELGYSHYQTQELAMSIGKNTIALALQSAAMTTGLSIAGQLCSKSADLDNLAADVLRAWSDDSIRIIMAGALLVALRKGIIRLMPGEVLAEEPVSVACGNIACLGLEKAKILSQIATRKVNLIKGLEQMESATVAMVGSMWTMAAIAPLGEPAATGLVVGIVGYLAGDETGNALCSAGQSVAKTAKAVGKAAWNSAKAYM